MVCQQIAATAGKRPLAVLLHESNAFSASQATAFLDAFPCKAIWIDAVWGTKNPAIRSWELTFFMGARRQWNREDLLLEIAFGCGFFGPFVYSALSSTSGRIQVVTQVAQLGQYTDEWHSSRFCCTQFQLEPDLRFNACPLLLRSRGRVAAMVGMSPRFHFCLVSSRFAHPWITFVGNNISKFCLFCKSTLWACV